MLVWLVALNGIPVRTEIDHGNPAHYIPRRPDMSALAFDHDPQTAPAEQPRAREFVFEGFHAADGLRVYQEQPA